VETKEVRTQLVYQVRVFVCSPQGELRLGMPASVEIALGAAAPEGRAEDHCKNGS
jgi:HlyD family secretion protein